jgi:type I restriction enzyme, S subunit
VNYQLAKLGDICDFVRGPFGGALKKEYFVESGIAVYEQQHAIYRQFTNIRYYIDEKKFKELKRFELNSGDLVMSCSGTMGKVAKVPFGIEKGIINQALLKLTPSDKINLDFLIYWMESDSFQTLLNGHTRGAAIQNVASVKVLKELEIPLPPLAEQQKIAAILDAADSLRQKDQQLVERYTALSQSLFLEMFGDPVTNPMGWEQLQLNSLVSKLGDGLHGTPEYSDDGEYFFINGNNLNHGVIEIYPETKKVPVSEFKKHKKELDDSTMLVSINGSIGKVAFYNGEPIILGKSACYFNIKESLINKLYLFNLIESPYFLNYAMGSATGSTIKNVSLKTMRELPVPLPPLTLQKRFAEHIQLIEAQKKQAQRSLEKSEALFNSLLQRAFTGELTAKMAA